MTDFSQWHDWFAWHPVIIRWCMTPVWLKTIERRFGERDEYHDTNWEYREKLR